MNLEQQTNGTSPAPVEVFAPDQTALTIQPLAQRSMFWRPAYLDRTGWLEQLPFAFWLVEAQRPRFFVEVGGERGVSYFAFCQAVDKLGLDTRCFSLGAAPSDDPAAPLFEKMNAYNQAHYSGFSRLVRSASHEALPYFADRSIDLLHIDGCDSYEAVSREFQIWLPKLSAGALVLVHGTNPGGGRLGVSRFFDELRQKHQALELPQGDGLGVVSIGPPCNELLQRLFAAAAKESSRRVIGEVFSRLGRACADSFAAEQQGEQNRTLTEEVERQKTELTALQRQIERAHGEFEEQSRQLSETISRMQAQLQENAVEKGQLAERVTLLQEMRLELKEETRRYQDRIASISGEFAEKSNQMAALAEALRSAQDNEASLAARIGELTRELSLRDEEIAAGKSAAKQAQMKNLALHQQSVARESELAALKRRVEEGESRELQLQQVVEQQSLRLDEALAELRARDEVAQPAQNEEAVAAPLEAEAAPDAARLQELEQQIAELQAENADLAGSNQARFQELAVLTRLLEERAPSPQSKHGEAASQQLIEKLEGEVKAMAGALMAAEQRVADAEARGAALLSQKEAALAKLEEENRLLGDERKALAEMLENRSTELAALTKLVEEQRAGQARGAALQAQHEEALAEVEAENRELRKGQQRLERMLEERFRELAVLTGLLEKRDQELERQAPDGQRPLSRKLSAPLNTLGTKYKQTVTVRKQLSLIERSGLFDESWYLKQYPDVAAAKVKPGVHYLLYGAAEGRNPGPAFNTNAYAARHPEVAASGVNPLLHYLQHEKKSN